MPKKKVESKKAVEKKVVKEESKKNEFPAVIDSGNKFKQNLFREEGGKLLFLLSKMSFNKLNNKYMHLEIKLQCSRCEGSGSLVNKTVYNPDGSIDEEVTEDPCTKCGGDGYIDDGYVDDDGKLQEIIDTQNEIKIELQEIKALLQE